MCIIPWISFFLSQTPRFSLLNQWGGIPRMFHVYSRKLRSLDKRDGHGYPRVMALIKCHGWFEWFEKKKRILPEARKLLSQYKWLILHPYPSAKLGRTPAIAGSLLPSAIFGLGWSSKTCKHSCSLKNGKIWGRNSAAWDNIRSF